MKMLGLALMTISLVCTGCLTSNPRDAVPRGAAPTVAAKVYPPVTPDKISHQNAHEWAQALQNEIDREAQKN